MNIDSLKNSFPKYDRKLKKSLTDLPKGIHRTITRVIDPFYFSKKWSHDRREETIFNYGIGIRNEIAVSGVSLAGRGRGWSIREITDVRTLRYGFYVRKLRTQLKPLSCQVAAATTGKLFEFRIEGGSEARRWNVNSLSRTLSSTIIHPPSLHQTEVEILHRRRVAHRSIVRS